jgi:hypothetical protein
MKLPVRAIVATGAAGAMAFGVVELIGLAQLFITLPVAALAALGTGGGIFMLGGKSLDASIDTDAVTAKLSAPKEPEITLSEKAQKQLARGGVSEAEVIAAIKLGQTKMKTIRSLSNDVGAPNVKRDLLKIAVLGDQIIENFSIDPKDVRVARAWLNTYLDQFLELIEQYIVLSKTGGTNLQAQRVMAKFPKACDEFKAATQALKQGLVDNDISSADVNMEVFSTLLKSDRV